MPIYGSFSGPNLHPLIYNEAYHSQKYWQHLWIVALDGAPQFSFHHLWHPEASTCQVSIHWRIPTSWWTIKLGCFNNKENKWLDYGLFLDWIPDAQNGMNQTGRSQQVGNQTKWFRKKVYVLNHSTYLKRIQHAQRAQTFNNLFPHWLDLRQDILMGIHIYIYMTPNRTERESTQMCDGPQETATSWTQRCLKHCLFLNSSLYSQKRPNHSHIWGPKTAAIVGKRFLVENVQP